MITPLIELEDACKTYTQGENLVRALDHINLQIHAGEFLSIVGSSGSGKSTMMNILGCLDLPTNGCYRLDGIDVSQMSDRQLSRIRNRKIGFVFQGFNLIPTLSALENVELPLTYRKISAQKRIEIACDALEKMGLKNRLHHRPAEMSGGQQQRVAIARAIAARPAIILADEPTGNLDSESGKEIIRILSDLHQHGRTVILITHDKEIAEAANRMIEVRDGKIITDRPIKKGKFFPKQ